MMEITKVTSLILFLLLKEEMSRGRGASTSRSMIMVMLEERKERNPDLTKELAELIGYGRVESVPGTGGNDYRLTNAGRNLALLLKDPLRAA
jgi:hypothetical protein